jgi:membrane protein DedA with SNARE-associated domain
VSNAQHPLDRFAQSLTAQASAFAWGLAEATVFFIVPDVLLTLLACRSIRASLKAGCSALLGAILGGFIMYTAGHAGPETSRIWLAHVPAIDHRLIQQVQSQLSEYGLYAVLTGSTVGIPYKIYAVEWGARHGDVRAFLLVSVPARGIRFLFSSLIASGIARLIAPWTQRRAPTEMFIWALFWTGFYALYFSHFGW